MGKHFDIGYFKKPVKVRAKVAKKRTIINTYYSRQKQLITYVYY